ncbi:hypothetical protein UF75_3962 [Desulfosporosinus sp. I2]|nr:hypothetical protein UF75_3962 [Desulfosporosinus sp. I2]
MAWNHGAGQAATGSKERLRRAQRFPCFLIRKGYGQVLSGFLQ